MTQAQDTSGTRVLEEVLGCDGECAVWWRV